MKRFLDTATEEISLPTIVSAVSVSDPKLAVFLTFLFGVIKVSSWRKRRGEEILVKVGRENIEKLMLNDDKTRDILHRAAREAFDESFPQKRECYYTYLRNLAAGIHTEFDYHSKIIQTINLITFEELDIFRAFNKYFPKMVEEAQKNAEGENTSNFFERGVNISEMGVHEIFTGISDNNLERILNVLSNGYGLISARFGRLNGTFYGGLTKFGQIYLEMIE